MKRFVLLLLLFLLLLFPGGVSAQTFTAPLSGSTNGRYLPPAGVIGVNWANPITTSLSLLYPFDQLRGGPLYSKRGTAPLTLQNGGTLSPLVNGYAITSSDATANGAIASASATTYTMPIVGTILVLCVPGFSPTDSVGHIAMQVGTGPLFLFQKWSDNNINMGFAGASFSPDARVTVAASGTFIQGQPLAMVGTWTGALTTLYLNGKSTGTNATATTTIVPAAGTPFVVDSGWSGSPSSAWTTAIMNGGINFVAIWDRVLSPAEIISVSNDTAQLFLTQADFIFATLQGPVVIPPAAKTLFFIGTP